MSQFLLLQTASDDSLIRLAMTDLAHQQKEFMRLYFKEQHHKSVANFNSYHIQNSDETKEGLLMQVIKINIDLSSDLCILFNNWWMIQVTTHGHI